MPNYKSQPSGLGQRASELIIQATKGGRKLTPQQEQQIYNQVLGPIDQQVAIPPGSRVIESGGARLVYLDPEGYQHTYTRNQNGNDANFGTLSADQTNRPAILPNQQQDDLLSQLTQSAQSYASSTPSLAALDPDTAAALKAINDAETAQLQQQFQDASGSLIARLYGNRTNQSSLANQAAARLAQEQGLVTTQQQANAGGRELAAREFLTNTGQKQNEDLLSLLQGLSGQQSTEKIANAGYALDSDKLAEMMRQFNANYGLSAKKQQLDEATFDQSNSFFNKFLKGLQAGAQLASGVGSAVAGIKA